MIRRVFAVVGFIVVLMFSACAQTSFIKQAAAFATERKTGTQMVDDNGNPVRQAATLQYNVYVELSGSVPQWKYAWYKNEMYSVVTTKIELPNVEVGINKQSGKKIMIQPKKGNQLWQLELLPVNSFMKPPMKIQAGEVLLEGIRNKKPFYFRVPKMVSVQTPDAV